jgi:hypothetical protein
MDNVIDAAGWIGALLIVGAYALVSMERVTSRSDAYQYMNVVGALGVLVNSAVHRAFPSAALNVAWMVIGLYALVKARQRRVIAPTEPDKRGGH